MPVSVRQTWQLSDEREHKLLHFTCHGHEPPRQWPVVTSLHSETHVHQCVMFMYNKRSTYYVHLVEFFLSL